MSIFTTDTSSRDQTRDVTSVVEGVRRAKWEFMMFAEIEVRDVAAGRMKGNAVMLL